MGLIYKITNNQNDKVYIGKTIQSLKDRWQQHKCDSKNSNKDYKLYRAMKKYGIENFNIEIVEDDIPENELGIKEQEYIKKFNSYYNGYNETFGGEGESSVDIDLLKSLYYSGKNFKEISQITGHTSKTVANRLKGIGLQSRYLNSSGNLNKGKPILFEGQTFNSLTLLAKYLKVNFPEFKDKKIVTIVKGISKSATHNIKYMGYYFNYL